MAPMGPPINLETKSINNNIKINAKVRTADKIVLLVKDEINIPKDKMDAASKINPK